MWKAAVCMMLLAASTAAQSEDLGIDAAPQTAGDCGGYTARQARGPRYVRKMDSGRGRSRRPIRGRTVPASGSIACSRGEARVAPASTRLGMGGGLGLFGAGIGAGLGTLAGGSRSDTIYRAP